MLLQAMLAWGQNSTRLDLKNQTKNADFSAFPYFLPPIGSALPLTCLVGQVFFKTNASAGSNLYGCTSANVWTAQAGGSGGSGITALTGDGTATGPGSSLFTLATVTANVGTFGDSTHCASLTVNAKGLVTAASQSTSCPGSGGGSPAGSSGALQYNNAGSFGGVGLGTATQVYHGNSGGVGSFGAVSLTADISGILPKANGGTGTATPGLIQGTNITITGSWPNQTINATGGGGGSPAGTTGDVQTNAGGGNFGVMLLGPSGGLYFSSTGTLDTNCSVIGCLASAAHPTGLWQFDFLNFTAGSQPVAPTSGKAKIWFDSAYQMHTLDPAGNDVLVVNDRTMTISNIATAAGTGATVTCVGVCDGNRGALQLTLGTSQSAGRQFSISWVPAYTTVAPNCNVNLQDNLVWRPFYTWGLSVTVPLQTLDFYLQTTGANGDHGIYVYNCGGGQ